MQKIKIEPFQLIGISIRTSNDQAKSAQDIAQLWGKFMEEGILEKIPNKVDNNIYSTYSNYVGDHSQPYDTILACKVHSLASIPEGMVGHEVAGGNYVKFEAKGDLTQGLVYTAWTDIWAKNLDRVFTSDFEIYGEKAQNPKDASVDIFVAIKE